MIKWINKLKNGQIIKIDKMLHLLAGAIIALSCFLAELNYTTVFLVTFIIAFLTEVYDEFFKSKFDWKDLIATQSGFFFALIIKLIIKWIG